MIEKEKITNLLPLPVIRVIWMREQIFLVGYINGIVELRDLSKGQMTGKEPDEPILSFNAEEQGGEIQLGCMADVCCKELDESKILMAFDAGFIGKLDLKTGQFTLEELPQKKTGTFNPRSIQFIGNLPSDEFIMLSENNFQYMAI